MNLIGEKLLLVTPECERNGCGSKGIDCLIPDRLFLVDFTIACDIHDCYYFWIKCLKNQTYGELPADILWLKNLPLATCRKIADNVFYRNMTVINQKKSPTKIGKYARVPLISLYYSSVRIFGESIINS
jgi:hypothetical protein